MSYEPKPRLTLFINQNEGNPIKKKDGSFITNSSGENILHGAFNGKINLPAGLPAGDYEVSVYRSTSKAGLEYLAGNIKPAFVKKEQFAKEVSKHSVDKGNAYQPQDDDFFVDDTVPY